MNHSGYQKPVKKKTGGNYKTIGIVILILVIIAAALLIFKSCTGDNKTLTNDPQNTGIVYDSGAVEGGWDEADVDKIVEGLNEKVEEGMINISMNTSPNFANGTYKSRYEQCTSHFIKASVLEAAILSAAQKVSEYALVNQDAFIEELKVQWQTQETKASTDDKKELLAAEKRMSELDVLIKGLYESNMSGKLPDRQYTRLMAQYDEEQASLENRIAELQSTIETISPKAADMTRFLALVKRYQNITELTDSMLYEFIEKVVVHAPTGGRTAYRNQQLDIYFNFIGNYLPPADEITEEERIAEIDAQRLAKKKIKSQRARERKQEEIESLREAAASDPKAAAQYEEYLQRHRESGKRHREKLKALKEADPEYISQLEEKERAKIEKQLELDEKHRQRQLKKIKESRAELVSRAKTDPAAAEELAALRAKEAEARARKKSEQEQRMAKDPEYAEMIRERNAEYNRRQNERRKAARQELIKNAETDPEAAEKLEAYRAYMVEAQKKHLKKMNDEAANGDPEAIAKKEQFLQGRRDYYYKKKNESEVSSCAI